MTTQYPSNNQINNQNIGNMALRTAAMNAQNAIVNPQQAQRN